MVTPRHSVNGGCLVVHVSTRGYAPERDLQHCGGGGIVGIATLQPGTIIALRYKILSLLGQGGMATVYRARHRMLERDVALKILAPQIIQGHLAVRFEREAKNAARLDHPGCVRVLDHGSAVDGSRFLAMELIDGPTLREDIDARGPHDLVEAVTITSDLLCALSHAHRAGMLHRDVKPANIMLATRDGKRRLVLIDFGLSQIRDDSPLTLAGSCMGSPSYLAPERLMDYDYDHRADLYSVGVILYELLTGTKAFDGQTPLEVAQKQLTTRPRPLPLLRPDLPHSIVEVVARAMSKNPAERFCDAYSMRAALEAAAAETRLAAMEATSVPVTQIPVASARAAPRKPSVGATTQLLVDFERRSVWRRIWAWLRFGRWRWRDKTA